MESQSSSANERTSTTGVGGHMLATPFSCRQCRLRKMKCDRVQPHCGRCIRLGDTCEYPKERRANVGRQKRVFELETKVGQLIPSHKLIFACPNECLITPPPRRPPHVQDGLTSVPQINLKNWRELAKVALRPREITFKSPCSRTRIRFCSRTGFTRRNLQMEVTATISRK